jgi:hypothetical protein
MLRRSTEQLAPCGRGRAMNRGSGEWADLVRYWGTVVETKAGNLPRLMSGVQSNEAILQYGLLVTAG